MNRDYFDVGVVTGTVGLLGHLRVFPVTDEPGRFNLLKEVYMEIKGVLTQFPIQNIRFHKKYVIIKLGGIDTVEEAAKFKSFFLKIPPELGLPLEEGQYYQRDLLNMTVLDEKGEKLGLLIKIIETAAHDVYAVRLDSGKEVLIPAIKQCVLSVDVNNKEMTVRLLPGLLEL